MYGDTIYIGASMRPPEFTGGKARKPGDATVLQLIASMRPPEFTGGKVPRVAATTR